MQCPLCLKFFPLPDIELHADQCGGQLLIDLTLVAATHPTKKRDRNDDDNCLSCALCRQALTDELAAPSECAHLLCMGCCATHVNASLDARPATLPIRCPLPRCPGVISREDTLRTATARHVEKIISKEMHLTECPQCSHAFELVALPNSYVAAARVVEGVPLTAIAACHHDRYRSSCRGCKIVYCAGCKASPYHIGFTCAEHALRQSKPQCRSCGDPVGNKCKKQECKGRRAAACGKVHAGCSHPCGGIAKEVNCLPCMRCSPEGLKGSDFCTLCWVEDYDSAPCIQLVSCGHIFHQHCIESRLDKKWHTPHVIFTFMNCPLCNVTMSHPSIDARIAVHEKLKSAISSQRVVRMKVEGIADHAIAERVMTYFMCTKCTHPYYGGRRECGEAEADVDAKNRDASSMLCPGCASPPGATGDCKVHGNTFMEYKCCFCCSVASYFCWGRTHFCTPCHNRAAELAGLQSKKKLKDISQCGGSATCPLKVAHPPHGTEHALGCGLCRART